MDNGQLICLYLLARLLQRELEKCLRLVTSLPMEDMDKHFGETTTCFILVGKKQPYRFSGAGKCLLDVDRIARLESFRALKF